MIAAENLKTETRFSPLAERRNPSAPLFTLVELDPREIIDGLLLDQGYATEDALPVGRMRETCPYCAGTPLQLVLRFRHLKRSHVFCSKCTRCFDALYPDGTSALVVNSVTAVVAPPH